MNAQYKGIVPYLFYDDAEAAMKWYARVFDFEEIGRWTNDDGQIQNAEMRIGATELWLDGSGRRKDEIRGQLGSVSGWMTSMPFMNECGKPVSSAKRRSTVSSAFECSMSPMGWVTSGASYGEREHRHVRPEVAPGEFNLRAKLLPHG